MRYYITAYWNGETNKQRYNMEGLKDKMQSVVIYDDAKAVQLPTLTRNGKTYKVKEDNKGNVYVSAYTDARPTPEQAKALCDKLCSAYRITDSSLYVMVVLDSEMTLIQLQDAILHIAKTWGNDKYGVPKPADVINYDKAVGGLLYNESEANKITYGLVHMFNGEDKIRDMYNEQTCVDGRYKTKYEVFFNETKERLYDKIGKMYVVREDMQKTYGKYIDYILKCSDARALTPEDREKINEK